jgi:hypothetical protein
MREEIVLGMFRLSSLIEHEFETCHSNSIRYYYSRANFERYSLVQICTVTLLEWHPDLMNGALALQKAIYPGKCFA